MRIMPKTKTNQFLGAIIKGDTLTENGAISNSTTGKYLVDQFAKSGAHRGRDLKTVYAEQGQIWGEDPLSSVKFAFYLRAISRKVTGFVNTEKVLSGQGARDEAFKRLMWVLKYHRETFYKNLWLVPVVGSWKDLFTLIYMVKEQGDPIDYQAIYDLIGRGIKEDGYNKSLIQKYLPSIKANSKCKTERSKVFNGIAKGIASHFGWSNTEYRKFKATGEAHAFQRLITGRMYDKLDWGKIPGKALFNLVKGKFLSRHGLEAAYEKWLEKQPVAKFTGYVHDLGAEVCGNGNRYNARQLSAIKKSTYDKQFKGLIELAKKNEGGIKGNVWVALDTSGSMGGEACGKTTALTVCKSLGVYFAELNQGAFHNQVIMFDSRSTVKQLTGDSFCDRIMQLPDDSMGSTNFQSVIDEIVRVRTNNPRIPLKDYPETLIVVSDMQFNNASSYYGRSHKLNTSSMETNYNVAMQKLASVGLPKIKIVWWQCTGRVTPDFPSTIEDEGTYHVSGFDGNVISLILGGEKVKDEVTGKMREKTAEEKVTDALNQEVLSQIVL